MDFRDAIIWTFLPTGTALDIIQEIDYKYLIYYCIADFSQLANKKRVGKTEDQLIKISDIIFVQGEMLEDKCRRFNRNIHTFPFGANIRIFDDIKVSATNYDCHDIKRVKRPIVGYIGGVHRHVDINLIAYVAKSNPEWSLVFIGPIQTDISPLKNISNVTFLGKKDFKSLPGYIKEFDVCIIPYLISDFTKTVYPTKLNEYHALGKPVISTDLPEISVFNNENKNLVFIGASREEFVDKIQHALKADDGNLIRRRIESAKRHSWDIRIEEMSALIEKGIKEKRGAMRSDWQKKFKQICNFAGKKFSKLVLCIFALWLLFFYTPFIWFLADPLKIMDEPEKSDAIVVFAGGVGESGKAGQGYEERVQYAAEFYEKGYARHIIFSSGYSYLFKEPLIMKALAVSLGVPEEAIILEDRARSTYENVSFSKEILERNGWDKILLISSPYHMRRVSLVVKKSAPEIKIIYTPIQNSRFYSHGIGPKGEKVLKQISLRQIKGIFHEYCSIIYYRFKGYI